MPRLLESGAYKSKDIPVPTLLTPKKHVYPLCEDETTMGHFVARVHIGRAMPKPLIWCYEAAVVHWNQETSELPSWQEAGSQPVRTDVFYGDMDSHDEDREMEVENVELLFSLVGNGPDLG